MILLTVFRAMFTRFGIELKRYAFNTFSMIVSIYLFFLLVFYGIQRFGGGGGGGRSGGFGETLDGVVVGFFVVSTVFAVFSHVAGSITRESRMGTLEQLAMSPAGLVPVLVSGSIASTIYRIGISFLLLFLMMATTGQWLHLDVFSVVFLLGLTVVGVQGIAFAAGGLALLYKEVHAALSILNMVLIGLVAVPVDRIGFAHYLPISWGSHLLREVMVRDHSVFEMSASSLTILVVNSAAYFAVGVVVFGMMERRARSRGVLGHY